MISSDMRKRTVNDIKYFFTVRFGINFVRKDTMNRLINRMTGTTRRPEYLLTMAIPRAVPDKIP